MDSIFPALVAFAVLSLLGAIHAWRRTTARRNEGPSSLAGAIFMSLITVGFVVACLWYWA